jgi:hypothetical protein
LDSIVFLSDASVSIVPAVQGNAPGQSVIWSLALVPIVKMECARARAVNQKTTTARLERLMSALKLSTRPLSRPPQHIQPRPLPDVRPLLLAALRLQPPPPRLKKIQSLLGSVITTLMTL